MTREEARANFFKPLTHAYSPAEHELMEGTVNDLRRSDIPFVFVEVDQPNNKGVEIWRSKFGMSRPGAHREV